MSFELARESVELGETSYADELPVGELSLLNSGGVDFIVTPKALTGDGADFVALPTGIDYSRVAMESSLTIPITLDEDILGWASGAYAPELELEIGSFWDDPSSWGEDPVWRTREVAVPIVFTLVCDVDEDGYEAEECGGDDCDDEDDTTWPGAPESFGTEQDNNCDGVLRSIPPVTG